MVSKRQKLARKRFKETKPDPSPAPSAGPAEPLTRRQLEKKKKLKTLKEKIEKKKNKSTTKDEPKKKKSGGGPGSSKHPLRVAGMRPGESCFICKSADHIAKLCPEKSQWERNKICLFCRQNGHSLKNCPQKVGAVDKKFCYNCGEGGHDLSKCPLPLEDGGTKYASCFICNERGHLSKNCPKNTHGIYPKGGSCKLCGGVTHLARDCPERGTRNSSAGANNGRSFGVVSLGTRTVFNSGDDLEDDFTTVDVKNNEKDLDSNTATLPAAAEKSDNAVKPKKKQGPKVVNFVG